MGDITTDFIRQNEWANLVVIDRCRGLTDDQLDFTSEGLFGSIRATLGHIVSAETHYATLLGQEVTRWDDDSDDWPDWDGLVALVRGAADALVAAAADAADQRIRSGSGKWDIDAPVIVVQAVHHGADHRSQINTLLSHQGLDPVEISSWGWGEATGRMHLL